jgi:hypothetical protein
VTYLERFKFRSTDEKGFFHFFDVLKLLFRVIFTTHFLLYFFWKIIFILFASIFACLPNIESTTLTLEDRIFNILNLISMSSSCVSIFY